MKNWREYDQALQERGSSTLCVTPEALEAWHTPPAGRRRRPPYSTVAIMTGQMLRLAFGVMIDSTGLKVYRAGEWPAEKHGQRGRHTWRKLHLAVNPDSGEILALELITNEVGELSMVGSLLDQIQNPITSVTADGAYDGESVYRATLERQPHSPPAHGLLRCSVALRVNLAAGPGTSK